MELLGYAGALIMGLVLGLLGGGGSILTVPILVYLFAMEPVTATGLSLFIVGGTSAAGILSHHRQGNVEWRTAAIFGGASLISVYITRHWLVPALPDPLFRIGEVPVEKGTAILGLFAIVMVLSAISMIRRKNVDAPVTEARGNLLSLILIGLFVGLLTGVLGAGGGFLIVPALVLLAGVDMKRAVGTSLLIIAVNAFIGFIGDRDVHLADHTTILLPFLALAVLGIVFGTRVAKHVSSAKLKPAFGWFVLVMGIYIIWREFSNLN